jgi:hypothetical protein
MLAHFTRVYKVSVSLLLANVAFNGQTPTGGLAPGAAIPAFSLQDQSGTAKAFNEIRGPKGAMIVFYRSADW